MRTLTKWVLISGLLLMGFIQHNNSVWAQQRQVQPRSSTRAGSVVTGSKGTSGLVVLARTADDSITLRWATSTAQNWQLLNRTGLLIRRTTLDDRGNAGDEIVLNDGQPIRPWAKARWQTVPDESYKASAELLYPSKPVSETNRFTFFMILSVQNRALAQAMGQLWVDRTVTAGKRYRYDLIPQTPTLPSQSITVTAKPDQPLPRPLLRQVTIADSVALINWLPNDQIFAGYHVERSADGSKSYRQVTPTLVLNLTTENRAYKEKPAPRDSALSYRDSIRQFRKTYIYRVRGINNFGELSLPSDTIALFAYRPIKEVPAQLDINQAGPGKVALSWQFPAELEGDILGFDIVRARANAGPYYPRTRQTLPPSARTFVDSAVARSNYYQVIAYDLGRNRHESLPRWISYADTIAPAPPTSLTGTITNKGVVQLSWKASPDPDVLGYKVYKTIFGGEEKIPLNNKPIRGTVFTETLSMRVANRDVYYQVVAVDSVYNHSRLSPESHLRKPDVIPPIAPGWKPYQNAGTSVKLTWFYADVSDVAKGFLYRRNLPDTTARLVFRTQTPTLATTFQDTTLLPGKQYGYYLVAVDSAGLRSERSPEQRIYAEQSLFEPAIDVATARYDSVQKAVLLTWTYPQANVASIELYRQDANQSPAHFTTLTGNPGLFLDQIGGWPAQPVSYYLLVRFRNNRMSQLSRAVPLQH